MEAERKRENCIQFRAIQSDWERERERERERLRVRSKWGLYWSKWEEGCPQIPTYSDDDLSNSVIASHPVHPAHLPSSIFHSPHTPHSTHPPLRMDNPHNPYCILNASGHERRRTHTHTSLFACVWICLLTSQWDIRQTIDQMFLNVLSSSLLIETIFTQCNVTFRVNWKMEKSAV